MGRDHCSRTFPEQSAVIGGKDGWRHGDQKQSTFQSISGTDGDHSAFFEMIKIRNPVTVSSYRVVKVASPRGLEPLFSDGEAARRSFQCLES